MEGNKVLFLLPRGREGGEKSVSAALPDNFCTLHNFSSLVPKEELVSEETWRGRQDRQRLYYALSSTPPPKKNHPLGAHKSNWHERTSPNK